jgi:hypothetical protein
VVQNQPKHCDRIIVGRGEHRRCALPIARKRGLDRNRPPGSSRCISQFAAPDDEIAFDFLPPIAERRTVGAIERVGESNRRRRRGGGGKEAHRGRNRQPRSKRAHDALLVSACRRVVILRRVAGAEGNDVVLAAGVSPGETVVIAGVHVLSPGQKVRLYAERATTAVNGAVASSR